MYDNFTHYTTFLIVEACASKPPVTRRTRRVTIAQCRCNVLSFATLMEEINLREEHISELQRTPFWHLIDAYMYKRVIHTRKFDDISVHIIEQFQPDDDTILIGSESLRLQSIDIKVIFGIISV